VSAEEVAFGAGVWVWVSSGDWWVAVARRRGRERSGTGGVSQGGVDGEETFDVEQADGDALLKEDFAGAAVAGLAHPVAFAFGQLALDDRASSQLPFDRRALLVSPCRLEASLVEVERVTQRPCVLAVHAARSGHAWHSSSGNFRTVTRRRLWSVVEPVTVVV